MKNGMEKDITVDMLVVNSKMPNNIITLVYKEIIAVKNGIQKFDFHLRTKNFVVEMDNSFFPKILEFCNKIPLNPQLLRLKDWFARYDFTVKHVKGHHNIIADILSRPPTIHLITPTT